VQCRLLPAVPWRRHSRHPREAFSPNPQRRPRRIRRPGQISHSSPQRRASAPCRRPRRNPRQHRLARRRPPQELASRRRRQPRHLSQAPVQAYRHPCPANLRAHRISRIWHQPRSGRMQCRSRCRSSRAPLRQLLTRHLPKPGSRRRRYRQHTRLRQRPRRQQRQDILRARPTSPICRRRDRGLSHR